jgi:hypothetical protein
VHRQVRHHRPGGAGERVREYATPETGVIPRAASPTDLATLFRIADGGTRRRLAGEVQSRHGNAGLVSLLGGGTRIHGLPAFLRAGAASDLLDTVLDPDAPVGLEDDEGGQQPAPTTSGTTFVVNDSTFSVSGAFVDMATDLAGRSEAGSVTSQVSDIYLFPTTDPVKLANITITESRSLPNWVDRGTPTPEQVAEWDRFRGAIGAHEQGHIDLDKTTFADVHTKAIGVSHVKANERIDAVIAAATAANDAYDAGNDHGRNAGTRIDTNVGAAPIKVP